MVLSGAVVATTSAPDKTMTLNPKLTVNDSPGEKLIDLPLHPIFPQPALSLSSF